MANICVHFCLACLRIATTVSLHRTASVSARAYLLDPRRSDHADAYVSFRCNSACSNHQVGEGAAALNKRVLLRRNTLREANGTCRHPSSACIDSFAPELGAVKTVSLSKHIGCWARDAEVLELLVGCLRFNPKVRATAVDVLQGACLRRSCSPRLPGAVG